MVYIKIPGIVNTEFPYGNGRKSDWLTKNCIKSNNLSQQHSTLEQFSYDNEILTAQITPLWPCFMLYNYDNIYIRWCVHVAPCVVNFHTHTKSAQMKLTIAENSVMGYCITLKSPVSFEKFPNILTIKIWTNTNSILFMV